MEQQGKQLLFSNMVSLSYHSLMYKMNKNLLKKKSIIKKKARESRLCHSFTVSKYSANVKWIAIKQNCVRNNTAEKMIQYQTTFHWMLMWPVPCCFGNKGKQIRAHYMSVIGVNSLVRIQRVLGSWDQWFLVPGYVPIGSHAAAGSREGAEFCWLMEAPGWISPCCSRCAGWRDAELQSSQRLRQHHLMDDFCYMKAGFWTVESTRGF